MNAGKMMDRLEELRRNLLHMNDEELREHIRKMRVDRRIVKEKPAARVAKKVRGAKAKDKLQEMLKGMTPQQIAALLGVKK